MPEAERVGFVDLVAVAPRFDVKLVERSFGNAGNESFPDSRISPSLQHVASCAPGVEVPDHRDQVCIRSPHAEHCASFSIACHHMRPNGFIKTIVAALVKQVKVLVREQSWPIRGDGSFGHFYEFLVYRKMCWTIHRQWDAQSWREDEVRFLGC